MEDLRQSLISLLNVVRNLDLQSRVYIIISGICFPPNEITIEIIICNQIVHLDQKEERRL